MNILATTWTCTQSYTLIKTGSKVGDLIETARMLNPEFLDDVVVFLTVCALLLGNSGQNGSDLFPSVLVRSVVCRVHNAIQQFQIVRSDLWAFRVEEDDNAQSTKTFGCPTLSC